MNRMGLIALLTAVLGHGAALADDAAGEPSDKARKVAIILEKIGLDSPEIMQLAEYVDERTDNGYLRLGEERVMDGTLALNYELHGGISKDQLELKFTPDDSHFTYTASPQAAMVRYQLKF